MAKGNYDPNESPEALAARLAKIREFVDAVNPPPSPDKDGSFDIYKGLCVSPGSCRVAGKCLGPCEKIEAQATPRTDSSYTGKWLVGDTNVEMVRADFARELERELAVAERKLASIPSHVAPIDSTMYENLSLILAELQFLDEGSGPNTAVALAIKAAEEIKRHRSASVPPTTPQSERVPICGTNRTGTVSRAIWDEAWIASGKEYGYSDSQHKRLLGEGFYAQELDLFRPGWRAVDQRIEELERDLGLLRHERNVLQKICAERSDEIERLSVASTTSRNCSRGGEHEIDQCHKCGGIFALSTTPQKSELRRSPCPHGKPHELDGRCAACDCGKPTNADCCKFVVSMLRWPIRQPALADRVLELIEENATRASAASATALFPERNTGDYHDLLWHIAGCPPGVWDEDEMDNMVQRVRKGLNARADGGKQT